MSSTSSSDVIISLSITDASLTWETTPLSDVDIVGKGMNPE
jgi:hypothetical protein